MKKNDFYDIDFDSKIKPKKNLGQHWLKDETVLKEIISLLDIKNDETIVEIGPGKGALTKYLIKERIKLIAIEYDESIIPYLSKKLNSEKFQIINSDFLEYNLEDLPKDYKIIGNIPYYITGKIIKNCLVTNNKPSLIVLLIQKEVAERLVSKPGEMSILSTMSQFYSDIKLGPVIEVEKFDPSPKVDSQVVIIKPNNNSYDQTFQKSFERVVKAGFSARRKKLHTALSGGLNISINDAKDLLSKVNINSNLRAQDLAIDDWLKLAKLI